MTASIRLIALAAALAGGLVAALPASAGTLAYGPYYGPNGGSAGAVVYTNPYTGNRHAAWSATGPNGTTVSGHGSVYHGPCGTAWRGVYRGPNRTVVARGVAGNGTCY
jgi:hypothetical protein